MTTSSKESKGRRAERLVERIEEVDEPAPSVGRVLRRAREHRGFSLREVERRTGRPNAYLSQVERGRIRQPDPLLLVELAELYGLNFATLAGWVGLERTEKPDARDYGQESLRALIRLSLQLSPSQRTEVLAFVEELLRRSRT